MTLALVALVVLVAWLTWFIYVNTTFARRGRDEY
jgi:hypothetical protein